VSRCGGRGGEGEEQVKTTRDDVSFCFAPPGGRAGLRVQHSSWLLPSNTRRPVLRKRGLRVIFPGGSNPPETVFDWAVVITVRRVINGSRVPHVRNRAIGRENVVRTRIRSGNMNNSREINERQYRR